MVSGWSDCGVDHRDTTCENCGDEHVEVGWAHICRPCWDENEREYQRNYLHGVTLPSTPHAASPSETDLRERE